MHPNANTIRTTNAAIRAKTLAAVRDLVLDRIKVVNGEGYGTASEHAKDHLRAVLRKMETLCD
jgi:hypothetical protein